MKEICKYLFICTIILGILAGCVNNEPVETKQNDEESSNNSSFTLPDFSNEKDENPIQTVYSNGSWNENIFTNDYFNFKLNMPTTWERMSDSDLEIESSNDGLNYLFQISDKESSDNVLSYVMDLKDYNMDDASIAALSSDSMLDLVIQYLGVSEEGSIYTSCKKGLNEEYGNTTFSVLHLEGEVMGYKVYQKGLVIKKNNYVLLIYMTSLSPEHIDEISKFIN